MFKNNEEGAQSLGENDIETVIGSSVKLEGDLVGQNNMKVYGQVNGKVKTKGNVFIEKSARVKADVEAVNVNVSGTVDGNVVAGERLEINKSGVVSGSINAKILSIATGATFSGQCNMDKLEGGSTSTAPTKPVSKTEKKVPVIEKEGV